jgi:hypothetical protein
VEKDLTHLLSGRVSDDSINETFRRSQEVNIRRSDGAAPVNNFIHRFEDLALPESIKSVLLA